MDITIYITDRKGQPHKVKVPTDMALNLMQVVQAYEIEPLGTVGICGGKLMCSSCHCYVLKDVNTPEKRDMEEATLSRLMHLKSNSRLSCQIPITVAMEGIEIALAPIV
ncbi:2Fe-2S iron-sulfur cluster-binding protein [Flavobacterium cellulosilyticum]|uniref:2Fe-2S iron-sulfur cluster binding domain-containing protein n=1 Tax=Flavobacterium cellulosilyticum TaxID=2541731 RepID=A0A4R5CBU2_9FLAO|nr:2Fe-2S iron-sulfur cluster-binding protein [Flavobacterium cellulosilyticum]TDD94562.1 2Fe-2S iron-sulfur cluster binding domain-containing protein [Flavobacterium cellulosilyticum]